MLPVTGEIRRGLLGCDQPLGPGLQGDFRCRFPGPYTRPVPLCASAAGVLLPVTAVFLLIQYTQSPAVCQPGIGERAELSDARGLREPAQPDGAPGCFPAAIPADRPVIVHPLPVVSLTAWMKILYNNNYIIKVKNLHTDRDAIEGRYGMKGKFGLCLFLGLAAEGALRFLVIPRMGWPAGLAFALAATALILGLYLLLTKGKPMAGARGRLLTFLWTALAAMTVAVQEEAGALLAAFLLLTAQEAAALWLDWRNVRCSSCGKHLPLFGDMDRCAACKTAFPA